MATRPPEPSWACSIQLRYNDRRALDHTIRIALSIFSLLAIFHPHLSVAALVETLDETEALPELVLDQNEIPVCVAGGSDLTGLYCGSILMHMRTTLNIDDSLLRRAAQLTGITEKTALVRLGLEALIARESARRLARLGGSEKGLLPIRRRRSRTTA